MPFLSDPRLGAAFTQEGQFVPMIGGAARGGMRRDDEISAALIERYFFWVFEGKFWRGSPHRRYRQLFLLKFEAVEFLLGTFDLGDSLGTE